MSVLAHPTEASSAVSPPAALRVLFLLWVGLILVTPTILLLGLYNAPFTGTLAAAVLAVGFGLTLARRAPKVATWSLVAVLPVTIWAQSQPAGGAVSALVFVPVMVIGLFALWTFLPALTRRQRLGLAAALVVVAAIFGLGGGWFGVKVKTAILLPWFDHDAVTLLADLSNQPTGRPAGCRSYSRAERLGPYDLDCRYVVGSPERPELVYETSKGSVYADYASGTEESGFVYSPAGPPVAFLSAGGPDWSSICFGHLVGDWYQYVWGSEYGPPGTCPAGTASVSR